jgi:hypothetical protein
MMRFRIWHVMVLTTIVALIITTLEQRSFRTVTVKFASPTIPPQLPIPNFTIDNTTFPPTVTAEEQNIVSPTHYWLSFETIGRQQHDDGVLSTRFGYNTLLKMDVRSDNLSTLEGMQLKIRYRHRSLPWATATQIQDEIAKHFEELLPKVDWDDSRPPNFWTAAG